MMKTRVNGTVRPEMDAGLRRGIAAAVVLLIVCVLAVGVVSADAVTVSHFDELERNITGVSGDRTIIVDNDISITRQLPIGSGNITLTTDGTDHTLFRNCEGYLFTVSSGGNLTITGNFTQKTKTNLTLDGMQKSPSNSLVMVSGGNFTLADGGILTNNTAYSGGGVYVNGGNFTMSGGILTNNKAYDGGGVYMSGSSTFTMSGNAAISDNTADFSGGGVGMFGGIFTMSGGEISDNKAGDGGGVYVDPYSMFKMSGGTISGNAGGDVYEYSDEYTTGGSSSDGNMANAFRVLFNDGATTLSVVTDLSYGDKLTKPEDPVKDGYTFAGWYKDSACTNPWDFETGIPGDMTLYAKWTAAGSSGETEATTAPTATATAVTTPQPTKTQTAAATTSAPEATTAVAVSPTLTQAPAPVAGALFGLLAAGVLLRRRFQ